MANCLVWSAIGVLSAFMDCTRWVASGVDNRDTLLSIKSSSKLPLLEPSNDFLADEEKLAILDALDFAGTRNIT
jgi:hypothetical protein